MALILCPECSHNISDKAISCPNCGYPISSSKSEKTLEIENRKPQTYKRQGIRKKYKKFPNGYGSVVKLSGHRRKPYEVRVNTRMDERNYPIYDVLGRFEDRTAALSILAKYNENPYDLNIDALTFEDVYKKWYDRKYNRSKKQYAKGTINCTIAAFKKCQKLHRMKFRDIRTLHMQDIIDDYTLSHATMEHIVNLFNQMYKYAIEFDIVQKNYATFVQITKAEDDEHGIPFTNKELSLLWQNKDKPFVDSILIFIYSGWRVSELLPMSKEKIDLINHTFQGGVKTTSGKNRIVPIHSKIYEMVVSHHNNNYSCLFGADGKTINTPGKYYPLSHQPPVQLVV